MNNLNSIAGSKVTADRIDDDMLASIAPLRNAGFAVQWLQPRSKKPAGEDGHGRNWTSTAVATLDDLTRTYRPGFNVGVRLGEPSRLINGAYLHVLDFDIRIPELRDEAWDAFAKLFPGVDAADFPMVQSGSGGESRHLYFTTSVPFLGRKLANSGTKHRARDGRWPFDWEMDLFGTGKQVVMPPSIHPSGQPYRWLRGFDFNLLALGIAPEIPAADIEHAGAAHEEVYRFETEAPRVFKPGQMERDLNDILMKHWDEYLDWVKIGQALHHQFGAAEEGFDIWIRHSRRSRNFKEADMRDYRRKYRGFGKYRGRPVTMGTVQEWAREGRVAALIDQFEEEPVDDRG